jgi:hypothetical protein
VGTDVTRVESGRPTKQQRREERRRAGRRRRLLNRLRRTGIFAAVLAVPGLLALECFGPEEIVEAEVIKTRPWRHFAADGTSHDHTTATLQIEGLSETTLQRADGYQRGQRVSVWIRRGRISAWPYFQDIVRPGDVEGESRQEATAESP